MEICCIRTLVRSEFVFRAQSISYLLLELKRIGECRRDPSTCVSTDSNDRRISYVHALTHFIEDSSNSKSIIALVPRAFNSQTSVALRNPDLGDSLQPCAFARAEELESSTHDQNHTAQPSHQRRSESSSYCTFDGRLSSSETSGS